MKDEQVETVSRRTRSTRFPASWAGVAVAAAAVGGVFLGSGTAAAESPPPCCRVAVVQMAPTASQHGPDGPNKPELVGESADGPNKPELVGESADGPNKPELVAA